MVSVQHLLAYGIDIVLDSDIGKIGRTKTRTTESESQETGARTLLLALPRTILDFMVLGSLTRHPHLASGTGESLVY